MDYIIGKVVHFWPDGSARIEVVGFFKDGKWNMQNAAIQEFPPCGKIYAPRFRNDFPNYKLYAYLCFSNCQENYNYSVDIDKDKYILSKARGGEVWQYPGPEILKDISDEDLCARPSFRSKTKTPDELYFFREKAGKKYICGPLNAEKKLAPINSPTEVMAWEYQEGDCILLDGTMFLIAPKIIKDREYSFKLDCMSKDQFLKWCNQLFQVLSKDHYSLTGLLDAIKELPPNDELTRSRLQRLKDNIDLLITTESSVEELQKLPAFEDKINKIIDAHKDKFLADAQKEVDKQLEETKAELCLLEDKVAQKKSELQKITDDYDLTIMAMEEEQEKIIKNKKNELDEIDNKYSRAEKRLKELQKKRETLIEDIQLQAEIFGGSLKQGNVWHYPLEQVTPGVNALQSVELENIKSRISDKCEYEVDMSFFSSQCKGWQVKDIQLGIALAHVTGNATYQLCQPSPQWISFKEFWDESLQVIWESALGNPEKWHFLLIENYNIALPECWGMPLWNILMGKATLLPCAQTPHYPNNLRIIVSSAAITSEDNTHLGLPTKINDCFKSYSWPGDIEWNKRKLQNFKEDIKELNDEFFITVY